MSSHTPGGLSSFLDSLHGQLLDASRDASKRSRAAVRVADTRDPELEYFKRFAPNAIQWAVGREYLDLESTYTHTRQYEVIRDFFQLRCPLPSCNKQDPESATAWMKPRSYLESENLLEWSTAHQEDVCPKCRTTRSEFLLDGLLNYYDTFHLVVGMRCRTGDTLIQTDRGLVRLDSLLPRNPTPDTFYPLRGVRVVGERGWEEASDAYYAGEAPTKVVSLARGMEIRGSLIHPVYAYSGGKWGWRKLSELQPGDFVEARVSREWHGSHAFPDEVRDRVDAARLRMDYASAHRLPDSWSQELGAILGYIVSGGQCTKGYTIKFTNRDEEARLHFSDLCEVVFGKRPHSEGEFTVSLNGAAIMEALGALGLAHATDRDKSVPETLWTAPREVVRAFLRAYFDGDGTSATEEGLGANPVVMSYALSERLARDLQQMLWGLGVAASISTTKSRAYGAGGEKFDHDAYSVRIYGRDILAFAEEVGFYSQRKQKALAGCVAAIERGESRDDLIPGVRDLLLQLRERTSWAGEILQNTASVRPGRYTCASRSLLRAVLDSVPRDEAPDIWDQLDRLCHPDSRFLRVLAVEDGPVEPLYDLHVPGTHSFVGGSVMNHNSGKTATAAIIGTYLEHVVTVLAHSQPVSLGQHWGLLPGQPFEITFIASTDTQAADTVWAYYRNMRELSPWIKRYVAWIKKQEQLQPSSAGSKWQYQELDKEINNELIRVKFNSKNSNSGGMAGRTRIGAFLDELSRFDMGESKRSAGEAYRVLENSLQTVRSAVLKRTEALLERRARGDMGPAGSPFLPWLGMMLSITSPISANDEAMKLLERAKDTKHMYARRYATWEFNPEQPRRFFDEIFLKDPIRARRDFGADPPKAASPLIQDPTVFARRTIDTELQPTVSFRQSVYRGKLGDEYVQVEVVRPPYLDPEHTRYICFDAGQNFDQFAGACAHGEWQQTPDGRQFVTVYDWVFRILPESSPRRDVWFDSVVEVMKTIKMYHTVGEVHFDRWQSTYLIQVLRDLGINATMSGTNYMDFSKFVGDAMAGKVRMLAPHPDDEMREPPFKTAAGLAFYELERLENDGKRVFNPNKGQRRGYDSDDVAQVVVHVNRMVQSSVVDISDSNAVKDRLHRESVGGIGWGRRGGTFRSTSRGW